LMVEKKDPLRAWDLYKKLRPLFDLFENSGQYVALAKAGLEMQGHPIGLPRKPLLPASNELRTQLKAILDTI
jgi:4-hydroxy-tetrahydrodipicolinate synthase